MVGGEGAGDCLVVVFVGIVAQDLFVFVPVQMRSGLRPGRSAAVPLNSVLTPTLPLFRLDRSVLYSEACP